MAEVKIQQVNRYTLTIDGVEHDGFHLDSEWEGMAKYVGPKGVVIVSRPNDFTGGLFERIFGESEDTYQLVKASPDLLPGPGTE